MSLISLQNKVERRLKHKNVKNNYHEIGTIIKKRRKEQNITQDLISNGICSISYLSKIENNQIIPNDMVVKEIMTKLEMDKDIQSRHLTHHELLKDILIDFFYIHEVQLEENYKRIQSLEQGIVFELGNLIYSTYKKEESVYKLVYKLENLVMNMDDFEIKVFLLFSGIFFINNNDYHNAYTVLKLIDSIHYKDDYLDALHYTHIYQVKQRLYMKNSSSNYYQKAQDILIKYMNVKRSNELLLDRINYIMDENIEKGCIELLKINQKHLHIEQQSKYKIIMVRMYIKTNEIDKGLEILNSISDKDPYYIHKLIYKYELIRNESSYEELESLSKTIRKLGFDRPNKEILIYFNTIEIKNQEHKKEYLRDIAIPYSLRTTDLSKLKLYTDEIMRICMESSRYKEATQYYLKYEKERKRIFSLSI